MGVKQPNVKGIIGAIQFEGWGANSGQAQIVLNRNAADEKRFVLAVTNETDGALTLFVDALKAMWAASTVEVESETAENLPILKKIAKVG